MSQEANLQLDARNQWDRIVQLLSQHPEWLDRKVRAFVPDADPGCGDQGADPAGRVSLQLRRLYTRGPDTWKRFIHCVCMELNLPLDLEVPLLSTWGHEEGEPHGEEAEEESSYDSQLHAGLKRRHQTCGMSPPKKQSRKQQLEWAGSYLQRLRTSAQQRYTADVPGPRWAPAPQRVYVPPILQWSRATAALDSQEAPGGPLTEDGPRGGLQDLFPARTGQGPRVTVLLGQAGMGKTTLARQLCRMWAEGQLPRFQAVFLLEFRLLNLLPRPLTLSRLLLDAAPGPAEADMGAVLRLLEKRAEGVLLIFDGLDQALQAGPEAPGSALALFSGLCQGTLLPGCRVLATSRPGKLPACLPKEAVLVHVWGFDGPRMDEYVGRFFGDQAAREAALSVLRAGGHVRGMCAVPALCQLACLCLCHPPPGGSGGPSAALPPTVTQMYLRLVLLLSPERPLPADALLGLGEVALRGLEAGKVIFSARDARPPVMAFGDAHGLLTPGPGGQETSCAFASLSLQEFFAALYLMASAAVDKETLARHVALSSRWVLRTAASPRLSDTLPTFLAGLAAPSCRPFLSHLAQRDEAWLGARQAAVVQVLRNLAARKLTGPKVVELCRCIGETQEPELAGFSARNFPRHLPFHNFPLTYGDLAAVTNVLGHREERIHLEFEGCPLEPCSPEALAGCGQIECLSFQSRRCGDVFAKALSRTLPTMGSLRKLRLSGSKITACGIGWLLEALLLCPQLEEICFQDNQLKEKVMDIVKGLLALPRLRKLDLSRNDVSVATLLVLTKVAVTCPAVRMLQVREADLVFLLSPPAETTGDLQRAPDQPGTASQKKETQDRSLSLRLQKCQLRVHHAEILIARLQEGPQLEEVDLSGNHLEDEGCRLMVDAAAQLGIIRKLDLSNNALSESGLHCVLQAASRYRTLVELHISLVHGTATFTFSQERDAQEDPRKRAASLHSPQMPSELPPCAPKIRLAHCGLQAEHLGRLCEELRRGCSWAHLDFSGNALGDGGAARLAQLLPGLGPLRSVDLSENSMSLEAVFVLAKCFSALQWPLLLDVDLESQRVLLTGDRRDRSPEAVGSWSALPAGAQDSRLSSCIPRSFRLEGCQLEPPSLRLLWEALKPCPGPLEVRLSCKDLSDQSLETLLQCLPQLPQLSLLRLAEGLSPRTPIPLASLFSLDPRVQKVDLRSLRHLTLCFRPVGEQDGGCYGRFTDCGLSPEHVEMLCGLLSKCEDLKELDLSANQLGDAGFRALVAHLPQMRLSGLLDLSQNSLSQDAVLDLVDALPACPRVREASVSLGSSSFQIHVAPREEARKTLRLSQCSFRPDHVPRLASSLSRAPQLTDVTLTQCDLGPEQLATLLRLARRPRGRLSLRVTEPWVDSVRVPVLLEACAQASESVTEISLDGAQKQLRLQLEFPGLESPDACRPADREPETHPSLLSGQRPGTCSRLRQLSLSQVTLCEAGCQLLGRLLPPSGLRSFRLTSSCVSSQGLAALASALSRCGRLEELDMSGSRFSGGDTQALLGALEAKGQLRRLDLSRLPLSNSALAVLLQALSHMTLLQSLRLDGGGLGDSGCCPLATVLRAAPGLEELGLSRNKIGDAGAQHLAALLPELPGLRKMDLSNNDLSPEGGVHLAESLALCRQLEELTLSLNVLGDHTALALARGLSQKLRTLRLRSTHLGPTGALGLGQALDGHPCVEEISLAQNSLKGSLLLLREGLPRLRQIDLISCEVDDQTAPSLAGSLQLCPALEEILLSWNLLGDQAAAALAQVLPLMHRLKKVDLEKNRITAHGAQLLAAGLAQGAQVQVIRLWSNPVPVDVARRLQSQDPRLNFAFFDKQPLQVPLGT
ncbi:protein NLRC5 [Sorex araneus]|uniref:protein NLRC5 n=1 Tax=Sorex araneus TaxID=42254 RepID=UPI002433F305|nr:protein NLRC5 [Sorex araneus]